MAGSRGGGGGRSLTEVVLNAPDACLGGHPAVGRPANTVTADQPHKSFDVVVAGGGIAALEATLALRDLAGGLVEVTVVSPPIGSPSLRRRSVSRLGSRWSGSSICFTSPTTSVCAW